MSFHKLVAAIRTALDGETMTVRLEEDPPSASFHVTLDGSEYMVLVQPTKAAVLSDELDDGPA